MDQNRLERRLESKVKAIGVARLNAMGIRFDLYSSKDENQCGVTDIVASSDEYVLGILYKIPFDLVFAPQGKRSKMDKIEGAKSDCSGNYRKKRVFVSMDERLIRAVTYVGTEAGKRRFLETSEDDRRVSENYFNHLLAGARQFAFPDPYVAYLRRQAGPLK